MGEGGMVTEKITLTRKRTSKKGKRINKRKTTNVKGYLFIYMAGKWVNYTLASKHLVISIITSIKHRKLCT